MINYVLGVKNPLDGARIDYSNKVDGKPTLVPKEQPKTFQETANDRDWET